MLVDNIFELVNKFSKEEDQISANFGFILKNNKKILDKFLKIIDIELRPRELKEVDIETQVSYDGGKSRIDLQLTIYDRFIVFIESKLYKNEEKIFDQLLKYKKILEKKRGEYDGNFRLVYVNKQPIKPDIIQRLMKRLGLTEREFFFFSWENLVNLTEECPNRETVKLFKKYIGDAMYAKKVIKEQKIKDIVEVLVVYTEPAYWELAKKKGIAVQGNSTPDARYIAFLRTHRGKKKRSAITHIAEVKYTESHVPRRITYEGFPNLVERAEKRGQDLEGTHKHYYLGEIVKLSREIPHLKGEGSKAQVNFRTKMSELLRVESVGKIKTLRKLKGN
ncbi:MAG: hypothetical protein AYK22_04770 [Thermoplasmatales archaeon SG8-52-3]|nr:MAG: hypothetical protein AYK22_04770 [Thermoplasmatales archaeon SG8-52-3]